MNQWKPYVEGETTKNAFTLKIVNKSPYKLDLKTEAINLSQKEPHYQREFLPLFSRTALLVLGGGGSNFLQPDETFEMSALFEPTGTATLTINPLSTSKDYEFPLESGSYNFPEINVEVQAKPVKIVRETEGEASWFGTKKIIKETFQGNDYSITVTDNKDQGGKKEL